MAATNTTNKKRKGAPPKLIVDDDAGDPDNKKQKLDEEERVPSSCAPEFLYMPVEMCNHVLSNFDLKSLISMLAVCKQFQRLIYFQMASIRVLNLGLLYNITLPALKWISEHCTKLKHVVYSNLLNVPTVDIFLEWCRSLAMYKKQELVVEVPLKLMREKIIDGATAFEIYRKEPALTYEAVLPTVVFMPQPGQMPPLIPKEFTIQAKKLARLQIYGHSSIEFSHHFICHHPGELNNLVNLTLQHVFFRAAVPSSPSQSLPNPLFNRPPQSLSNLLLLCVHGLEYTDFWPLITRGSRHLKLLQLIAVPSVNDDILGGIDATEIEAFHIKECKKVTQQGLVQFLNRCHNLKVVRLELTMGWDKDPNSYKYLEEHLNPVTDQQASTLYRFIGAYYWSKEVYDIPRALEFMEKILVKNPKDDAAWADKGTLLGHIDMFNAGINCLDKAIALNDKNTRAWESKVVYLENTKQFEQAIECYPRVLNTPADWANKASFLWKQNADDSLIECVLKVCNMGLERFPESPGIWEVKGHGLLRTGKCKREALDAYEMALKFDPTLPTSQAGRAAVLSQLGRLDDAIAAYQVALDNPKLTKPDAATLCFARGGVYIQMKRYEEALDSIDIAIGIAPQKSNYVFKRAEALIHMRRLDEALVSIQKGLDLDPTHQRAIVMRDRIIHQLESQNMLNK